MNITDWLKGSADNSPGGASSKKLSAFWSLVIVSSAPVFMWMVWAFKNNDWSMLPSVLTIMLTYSATCLGINAAEKIKGKATTENEPTKEIIP